MKKEVKRRAIECAAAAVLYIVAIVGSSYAELEREMRLLIFLLPYLIMVFATVRLLWNNLKKRKLFDENLLILLATAGAFAVHRYSEAVGAMLFFQIGKLLELISMSRTRKSIEKFMDIRPQYANLKISGGDASPTERIDRCIEYIAKTPQVRDVLLSGGDALLVSDDRLEYIISRLRAIPHVEIIRIGSRTPVVCPQRITPELVNMLKKYHPIWLNTHFNHPSEITEESAAACARLADAGIPLGNQTVLLRGINDCTYVMKKLMHGLVKMRVRPYYIYQCDLSMGIEHFRTPVSKGIEIIENLRGHTSGYAVPTFVVDAPGGGGKTPVMPNYVISQSPNRVVLRNYEGVITTYTEPTDYKEECHCPECEQARKEGVAALLNGDMLSIEPKHLARNERNHHE